MSAERVVDIRNQTGESPVWSTLEQALYWVDIPACKVHRWSPSTDRLDTWTLPQMVGCLALDGRQPGLLTLGMAQGFYRARLQDGVDCPEVQLLARVEHPQSAMRLNDGRCDRQGNFWAGSMHLDMGAGHPVGQLYRLDPDRQIATCVEGLTVPNGLAFSPDNRTLYLSDSHPSVCKVWQFDHDPDSGRLSNRRLFIDMAEYPGRPDGAAIDAEGGYWICGNDAGMVHRFTPDGRLDRSLSVPVAKPAMCAFGGARLDTLYVTSIRPDNADALGQPLAGAVFALDPGVCGLPEPAHVLP